MCVCVCGVGSRELVKMGDGKKLPSALQYIHDSDVILYHNHNVIF